MTQSDGMITCGTACAEVCRCTGTTVHAAPGLFFGDGTKHNLQHAMSTDMQPILRPCTLSSQGAQNTLCFRRQLCCADRDAHMLSSVFVWKTLLQKKGSLFL